MYSIAAGLLRKLCQSFSFTGRNKTALDEITDLIDTNMNEVVTYSYDSWGKLLNIGGSLASTVGQINPFRYRGYCYDTETGLYYLLSRYYDPNTGRFLNADGNCGKTGDLLSANMFAYCKNNPVNMSDPNGDSPIPDCIKNDMMAWATATGQKYNIINPTNEQYISEAKPSKKSTQPKVSHSFGESLKNSLNVEVGCGYGIGAKAKAGVLNLGVCASLAETGGYNGKTGIYGNYNYGCEIKADVLKNVGVCYSHRNFVSGDNWIKYGVEAPADSVEDKAGLYAGDYLLGYSNQPGDWVISIGGGGYVLVGGEAEISLNLSEMYREVHE